MRDFCFCNVWAEVRGDNVHGECILIDVSGQVSYWGEFRFHEVYDLSQHCVVTVIVASEVSCHTAVVENMQ